MSGKTVIGQELGLDLNPILQGNKAQRKIQGWVWGQTGVQATVPLFTDCDFFLLIVIALNLSELQSFLS